MQAQIGCLVDSDNVLDAHNRPIRPDSFHPRRNSCCLSLFLACYGANKVVYVNKLNPHANHQSPMSRRLQDEFA